MPPNNNESPARVENKGGELREDEKQKILQKMREEKEGIKKQTEDKTEEQKRDIENTMITNVLDALVGTTLDHAADGTPLEEKRIQAFVESLTDDEKEYMKTLLTGNEEDLQKRMVDDRLNALRKSLGDEPSNEAVQKIEELKKGMLTLLPGSAKKYEQMFENMLNGLIANIAEKIAEAIQGMEIANNEILELSLAFRMKQIEKESRNNHPKKPKDKIDRLVKQDVKMYEDAYRKWMKNDSKEKSKEPPKTLEEVKKMLEKEGKKDEGKDEVTKEELENGTEKTLNGKHVIAITKNGDKTLSCARGNMIIKIQNVKTAEIESTKRKDGTAAQVILIKKEDGTELRIDADNINAAFNINDGEKKVIKAKDSNGKEEEIPFENVDKTKK